LCIFLNFVLFGCNIFVLNYLILAPLTRADLVL
jgi:hypothetical protein